MSSCVAMEVEERTDWVAVEFSPPDALRLSRFLEQNACTDSAAEGLAAVRERLGDARSLAVWLREKVRLFLLPEEAQSLLDTLASTLALGRDRRDALNLAGLREQVVDALVGPRFDRCPMIDIAQQETYNPGSYPRRAAFHRGRGSFGDD